MEFAVMLAKLSFLLLTREIEGKVDRLWDGLFFTGMLIPQIHSWKMIREERHSTEALQSTLELSVVLMHQCLSFEISASVIWELHEWTKRSCLVIKFS